MAFRFPSNQVPLGDINSLAAGIGDYAAPQY